MTTNYNDLAHVVDSIRNARFGDMVKHTEALIESGDWRDFTTPAGFHFTFRTYEFDYFLLTMSVDPTTLRHAYLYATDLDDLTVKQIHLADITGRGKTAPKGARRSVADMVAALAGETSGAAARIQAGGQFVTDRTGAMAQDSERRQAAKRGKPVLRDTRKQWKVQWSDDKPTAQAIVDKLLKDDVLARDVYKKLDVVRVRNNRDDKRSSTA